MLPMALLSSFMVQAAAALRRAGSFENAMVDGIRVGAIGRQEHYPGPALPDKSLYPFASVT